jgi:hypothetical protein
MQRALHAEMIDGANVSLSATNNGEDPAASPWGVLGGLRGLGDNLGAAIFNSKIQVNYQYKARLRALADKTSSVC